jgi:hemoglobin
VDDETVSRSVYEIVGGEPFFDALVGAFYSRVESDQVLRPLYPSDLAPSRDALAAFLAQYFGGPPRYSAAKGHPRLRMRHAHLRIGRAERDAWYGAMAAALADVGSALPDAVASAIMEYFARSADWMINTDA